MKRFTEALKWRDPWFRELSVDGKLVFFYFLDNCDVAGVWEPDYSMVNFCLKRDIDWAAVWEEFGDRIVKLPSGKLWMRKFVEFQYGKLTDTCAPHRTVIACVLRHGLEINDGSVRVVLPYQYPPPRVKDKEEDKDKEKDKEKGMDGDGGLDLGLDRNGTSHETGSGVSAPCPVHLPPVGPELPVAQLIAEFHDLCRSLPRVTKITEVRMKMIRARWSDAGSCPMEWFRTLFRKAAASDFVSGRNGAWTGASFDWLLAPSNSLKVIEGNYDNKSAGATEPLGKRSSMA